MDHNSVTTHDFEAIDSGFDPLDNVDPTQFPYTPAVLVYYARFECECGATEYRTYAFDASEFSDCCRQFNPTEYSSLESYEAIDGGIGTVTATFTCANCGETHEQQNSHVQRTLTESYSDSEVES